MIHPGKVEFAEYVGGVAPTWEDWSQYLTSNCNIQKQIESENEGEAGVITLDSGTLSFRYSPGNPVYEKFSIDLSEKQRYLFRITDAINNVQQFEGMADFSKFKGKDGRAEINIKVVDKLSALGVLSSQVARVASTLTARILAQAAGSNGLRYSRVEGNQAMYLSPRIGDTPQALSTPIIFPGEIVSIPMWEYAEIPKWENHVVMTSSIVSFDGTDSNIITVEPPFADAAALEGQFISEVNWVAGDPEPIYYEKEIYGIDCYNYNSGVLVNLNGIKVIEGLYKQAWEDYTIVKKPSTLSFNFPAGYAVRFIDEAPFDGDSLDALKKINDTMQCYVYIDKSGNLVIQEKSSLNSNGTTRTIGTTKNRADPKWDYFWDKLSDGVEVTLDSWVLDAETGGYLQGNSTVTKELSPGSGIHISAPKNKLSKTLLTFDANDNTIELLNAKAQTFATSILGFYGLRRKKYTFEFQLDDNTCDWEILDNLVYNSIQYFFTTIEFDLIERSVRVEAVEVVGHDYDFRQILVALSENNSMSVAAGQSYSSGTPAATTPSTPYSSSNIIYPEAYGAIGNGSADDTAAVRLALLGSIGKTIVFTKNYKITEKIAIDLNGLSIEIAGNGAIITSTAVAVVNDYYSLEGAFYFTNADQLIMRNINFAAANTGSFDRTTGPFFDGVIISDCTMVKLDNVHVSGAPQYGLRIQSVDTLIINNSSCSNNYLGGLGFSACKHVAIVGGDYDENGCDPPVSGYGIASLHQYGTGIDNENIYIAGVRARKNLRKGIDIHGGVKVIIENNFVTGFVYGGIYAVNEGANEANHLKHVADVQIRNNVIENDATWFAGLTLHAGEPLGIALQAGSYNDGASVAVASGGSWIIDGNILKKCNMVNSSVNKLAYIIECFAGTSQIVSIKNNHLEDAACSASAIYVGSAGAYGQPLQVDISGNKLLNITAGEDLIFTTAGKEVHIHHNDTLGCAANNTDGTGIEVIQYDSGSQVKLVKIDNNCLDAGGQIGIVVGTISNSVPVGQVIVNDNMLKGTWLSKINIASDNLLKTSNNYYNDVKLPDQNSASTSRSEYSLETSDSTPLTIDTMTVDISQYVDGAAMIDIEIMSVPYNNNENANIIFKYIATASPGAGFIITRVSILCSNETTHVNDYIPTLSWVGTSTVKVLRIALNTPWTKFYIKMNNNGWRLMPYYT